MLLIQILYLISAMLLAAYGLQCLLLTWLYRRQRKHSNRDRPEPITTQEATAVPRVTVQLPVYNERHVVNRLIDAVAHLNWPPERLQIQLLDDSTDDTSQMITSRLQQYQDKGIQFEVVHRSNRQGFKAGALRQGLATASGEFIAIFDADFVPPPDFLQRTLPHFADDNGTIGCVQTRWGHLNADSSWLTKAQAMGVDGHFIVEQTARNATRAFLNFNGTAGVWRRACLEDAGGWKADTLTEDLDLSYRAQLRGWRIAYEPQIVAPAELPVQIDAFKRQQFRWAKGSMQTAVKLLGRLWRSPQPLWRKVLGTLHMTNYAVHPLLLLNLLLTWPLAHASSVLVQLAPILVLSAIGPSIMYLTAVQTQALSFTEQIKRLAVLIAVGIGLSVSNTRAVLEAIVGVQSAFKRTPKFAAIDNSIKWQASQYALPRDPTAWVELLLALYATGLLVWSISQGAWWLIIWLLLYATGYGYIAGLSFVQARQTRTFSHNTA